MNVIDLTPDVLEMLFVMLFAANLAAIVTVYFGVGLVELLADWLTPKSEHRTA